MSTFEKVRDITVEQLSVDADEVKMESAFIDDLGADSLDIVELIMAFEEEFGVEIPDEKAEKIMELAKKLETEDEYICQDNRDLLELEQRYEKLDIPYQVRRVIDDYIACMRTRDERFAQLCCMVRS